MSKTSETFWYTNKYVDSQAILATILAEHHTGRNLSVYAHFGIDQRASEFKAAVADQTEHLHSLIDAHTCSCGLVTTFDLSPIAILLSPHHRTHDTLAPEPKPVFRGLVGKRLWVMGIEKHPVDMKWDAIISSKEAKHV